MILFPNCKINLGLNIINKRADGYHNLETCFYPLKWHDVLEIIPSSSLEITSSGINIPGDPNSNLCIKAWNLLAQDFKIEPVKMHLHKIVPIGAGLGGGSSDAAFTIIQLNNLFNLNLSKQKLIEYASQLGSDCAFFIKNEPVFAFEKGDRWDEIKLDLGKYHILVIFPNIHVSTAEAYKNVYKRGASNALKHKLLLPLNEWRNEIENDFEKSVFSIHPILSSIKQELYSQGAIYASMSGSGSAMFGIFEKDASDKTASFKQYLTYSSQL